MATKKKGIKLKIFFSLSALFIQHIFIALEGVVSWVVGTSEFHIKKKQRREKDIAT
jgi:hypothetical protein